MDSLNGSVDRAPQDGRGSRGGAFCKARTTAPISADFLGGLTKTTTTVPNTVWPRVGPLSEGSRKDGRLFLFNCCIFMTWRLYDTVELGY